MSNHSDPPLKTANGWRQAKMRQSLAVGVWSLFIFLFYALTVYVVVVVIIGNLAGYDFSNESPAPPLWLTMTSLIPVILTAWPVQKWIRQQVAHLLAWETSDPHSFVNQLTQQIIMAQTADQLMPALVQQLATLLNAPYVAIESNYATLSAAIGQPTRHAPHQLAITKRG